jgi:cell division protein ZapE
VWLTFAVLCEGPRSQADYIELARLNHTVILADVPVMQADRDDAARRFIGLIDELYDSGVKLIVSAAAEPADLYRGERLAEPFQRTLSRLIEMRSAEYLARPHRSEG